MTPYQRVAKDLKEHPEKFKQSKYCLGFECEFYNEERT